MEQKQIITIGWIIAGIGLIGVMLGATIMAWLLVIGITILAGS